ncbi:hypothetical protein EAF00_001685 [Botryotinia globosa]|nr:hypothetical protein EAF00_001685 [Botryotinia globosa]
MHLVNCNAEKRPEVLRDFIHASISSNSHIPWIIDADFDDNTSGLGRLRGHIARQNPQAKAIIESCTADKSPASNVLENDVLLLFNGPVHHYVTPKFYKQTKPDTGNVVPTWDYEAVELYGKAKVYYDSKSAESGAFLAKQICDLSEHMETSVMGYGKTAGTHPWKVEDAPERYIELLTKNIIGIEIKITSMSGRFKWSQEKNVNDRAGVIEGFKKIRFAWRCTPL